MPPTQTSIDVRAAAMADLASGESPVDVAKRYNLNPATVRKWKERLPLPPTAPTVTHHVTPRVTPVTRDNSKQELVTQVVLTVQERQNRIYDRLLTLLEAKIVASEQLAKHITNPAWLDTQSAADLADLGDYLDRTTIGLLALLAGRDRDKATE
jgi:transposase